MNGGDGDLEGKNNSFSCDGAPEGDNWLGLKSGDPNSVYSSIGTEGIDIESDKVISSMNHALSSLFDVLDAMARFFPALENGSGR